jgi:hypothetical protein
MATTSVTRNRPDSRTDAARLADVRRQYTTLLFSLGYNTVGVNESWSHFERCRTMKGCEALEPEDWRLAGGFLVAQLEPLLPPVPLSADEINRRLDEASRLDAIERGRATFEPTEADRAEAARIFDASASAPAPSKPARRAFGEGIEPTAKPAPVTAYIVPSLARAEIESRGERYR